MAEGYLRHFLNLRADVYSAGIETHGLNPRAVEIMREDGIDISEHTSNHVDEYSHVPFHFVITVCDNAKENCPYFPNTARRFHVDIPDPAKAFGSTDEIMEQFRLSRNLVKKYCLEFISDNLNPTAA
jgi:arsenate reductase (thioredoxin)